MTQLAWNLTLQGHSKSQALVAEQVLLEQLKELVTFAHQESLLQMDWHDQDRRCLQLLLALVLLVVAHAPHQPSKWCNAW